MEKLTIASFEGINFHFIWVKAHSNIPVNNKVDDIAKNTKGDFAQVDCIYSLLRFLSCRQKTPLAQMESTVAKVWITNEYSLL